jgi:hypothetical protein
MFGEKALAARLLAIGQTLEETVNRFAFATQDKVQESAEEIPKPDRLTEMRLLLAGNEAITGV